MKHFIPEFLRPTLRRIFFSLWSVSLDQAVREQKLLALSKRLAQAVPMIDKQYTTLAVDSSFLRKKIRYQHAFQISLVQRVIREFEAPTIVDIGDSAGTHIQYLQHLAQGRSLQCLSVNIDPEAVKKIQAKGLRAINARAEELNRYNIQADIFMCFETLEHLMNPAEFFYGLSSKTGVKYLVVTVPYVSKSRVGLHYIRHKRHDGIGAERTHIFELSPQDLRLIAQFSGWRVMYDQIYLQYPKRAFLRATKLFWRKYDFEGFYGMILTRDDTWSKLYLDW